MKVHIHRVSIRHHCLVTQNHDDVPPNYPKTPNRAIRIPDELWHAALETAHARGEYLSDIVRDCLRAYVEKYGGKDR